MRCSAGWTATIDAFPAAWARWRHADRPITRGTIEDPGAHLCHVAEYIRSASAITVPAGGAWVDTSTINGSAMVHAGVPSAGRFIGVNACNNWTDAVADGYAGTWISPAGGVTNGYQCNVTRCLACCL